MMVRPHNGRCRNVGSGLRWSTSGCPAGVRGLMSHTILPHSKPLHSKTSKATLSASNQVPPGTSAAAERPWMTINSRTVQAARSDSCSIDCNEEISYPFEWATEMWWIPRPDPSAAELGCEVDETVGDHVEIVFGLEIPGLVGAVLERPADKGGVEAPAAGGNQVTIVGRHHHALLGLQVEEGGGAVIGLGLRLVGVGDFGAEDRIPRQAGMPGHVHHQRDVAVRQGREDELALEAGQAFDGVRPPVE